MNLKEAIEASQRCKNEIIVRECMHCHEPLDEQSKIILDERGEVEFILSHGCCEPCIKKYYEEIPPTLRTGSSLDLADKPQAPQIK